jgi:cell division ATPase FtsA
MGLISGFKNKNRECFLALGVGNESIKALFFKKEKGEIIVLENYYEYIGELHQSENVDFDTKFIEKAIISIITKIQDRIKIKPLSVLVELPANILKARIVSVDYQRENFRKIISPKEETDIYHIVFKKIKEKAFEEFGQKTGILAEDFHFIALDNLGVKIDGYEIQKIQGFSGKELSFKFLVTFLPQKYFEEFGRIGKNLKFKNLKLFHEAQGLKYYAKVERLSGVFVDIGGILTKIFLVKDGRLEMIKEFEMAGSFFSSALSESLGITSDRARVLKEDYSKKMLSEQVRQRIREIILPYAQKWFSALKAELRDNSSLLPHNFFLFGGESQLPEIEDIIENGDWKDIAFISQPEVKILLPKDLKNIQDKTQSLNNPREVSLLLLCYYA